MTNINIIVILLTILGCRNTPDFKNSQFLNNKYQLHDSLTSSAHDYTILYRVDNECSLCIGKFMEFSNGVDNSKLHSNRVKCVYFAKKHNTQLFDYYLEKFKIDLEKDDLVYADLDDMFKENLFMNDFEDPNNFIILLDKQSRIVDVGNPFEDERSRKVYEEFKIL